MKDADDSAAAGELSIGTLSVATGVPVDTLRTWERRYGFPSPVSRTDGSHRRYATETVEAVQLVVRALQLGHRASAVVGRSARDLQRLIDVSTGSAAETAAIAPDVETVHDWLSLTKALDADRLTRELQRRLAERSVLDFLDGCLGPYLTELGQHWSSGAARISHEHFATECVTEFLQQRWRPLSEARSGADVGSVVLATPPGERHVLGLHMAAWVVALAELRVVFLGADTPMEEIAFAVRQHRARGVVLSVSAAYRGDLQRELKQLTAELPPAVEVVVGGAGARLRWKGARVLNGFSNLKTWAQHRSMDDFT